MSKPIICSKAIPGKIQFQIKCLWWSGRTLFPVWSSSLMWENMVLWLNKAIKYGTRGGAGPRLASLMFTRVNWFSIAGHVKLQALACHQSQKSLKSCPPVSKYLPPPPTIQKWFPIVRDPTQEYFQGKGKGTQPKSLQIGKHISREKEGDPTKDLTNWQKYFKGNRFLFFLCICFPSLPFAARTQYNRMWYVVPSTKQIKQLHMRF